MDRSGVSGVRGDREDDRMVARARPAIRSRICQPSLACRTTFLINDRVAIIQRAFSERLFYRLNVIHLIVPASAACTTFAAGEQPDADPDAHRS